MLYGSETWFLKEKEIGILRRREIAMMRAMCMCGVKLIDRKKSQELMDMLGIEKTIHRLAKENGLRWYGHVLQREEGNALKKVLHFEVDGTRKRGRPLTWRNMVNKKMMRFALTMDDAKKSDKMETNFKSTS